MNANEYRKWIEAGLKDYGDAPWFFIRELAQNSRDAGAGTILRACFGFILFPTRLCDYSLTG